MVAIQEAGISLSNLWNAVAAQEANSSRSNAWNVIDQQGQKVLLLSVTKPQIFALECLASING